MLFKAVLFATFVALASSQQAIQQYTSEPFINVPGKLVFPQGQYWDNYNGQYQPQLPFNGFNLNNIFKQYPYISLVNSQNEPLGYIYWVNSEVILQQQQNFLPVRDFYGNLLGYFTQNLYKPGQQFQPQILNEYLISQLGQFGFIYNQPSQDKFGFIIVKNPYVFQYNDNGVLRPNAFQNEGYQFQFPYNFFGPKYNTQYQYPSQYFYGQEYQSQYFPKYNNQYQYQPQYYNGQQYQSQYFPRYQGQYYPFYKFPYNYNQYVPAY